MKDKMFYEDPNLELLHFQICDVLTTSDTDYDDEDDYIELPVVPVG